MTDDDKSRKLPVPLNLGGRPIGYRPEFCTQVRRLALLGVANTTEQIAAFFGVCPATIYNWKAQFPEFLDAVREGKLPADCLVAEKLFEKATGFELIEEQAFKVKEVHYGENGKKLREIERIEVVPVLKRIPPDTAAQKFWLHNRQGRHWQEKPVISGDEEKRPLFELPRNEEEAQRIRDEKFSHWLPKTKQKTDE